ncbi:hypothetical protein [Quatrionicoccus australiensis]|uniref:hypothetical protein n=1 Tax=Quatrionicoccus australiensis TaxID=138118 RepID=UPI001CFA5DEF|nr:hypothetical protein [Quatrionicoccus australiensis]MCB4359814.1 hypothetical protein [Quatrionicoccus australiensis]
MKSPVHFVALLLAVRLFVPGAAQAAPELFWLTDSVPKKAQPAAVHAHGNTDAVMNGEEADTIHNATKHLWFRVGDQLADAAYLDAKEFSGQLLVLDALGMRSTVDQVPASGLAHSKMEFKELGFNNAYARRELLSEQTLWVQTAKAEVLKGSCCEREVAPEQLKAISDPDQPLELVREHMDKEKLFTRIVSGDTLQFTVLGRGQPLAGVPVTMLTQQGWQKKAISNEQGVVEFTLIRDYFPAWNDFRRRTKESYVLVADREVAETGMFQGNAYKKVHYQTTLSGKYAPSPHDYKSYAYGLGIAVFVLAFGGLGVYLYRRRRVKPFQEVRFSEGS